MFKSLTTRIIAIFIGLLTAGVGSFTFVSLKREQAQLINSARESTQILLNTIERSIFNSMSIGNTDDVQLILQMVGQSHRLRGVRIFHPQGIVLKSSNPAEVGKPVNDHDYQLFMNNRREGVYEVPGEGEILGMVKPIYNEQACHFCHGARTRILGVLNVNYSLEETKRKMTVVTRLFFFTTIGIIIILSIAISIIMYRLVKIPLERIIGNMARVEEGDLSVRMNARSTDEIGHLITSFNSMVKKLDKAKRELELYHFEQMERADRLASMGEMSAGIAHEIKNPLTGIAAAITIINEDLEQSDPRKEILQEILEQIKRLDKTVNDLLFFGKPGDPEFVYADVNAIVQKTLWFAAQHRGGKGVDKRLELAENLPPVFVDPKLIQQVFLNLILNAVQAMQGGGTLTVTTSAASHDGRGWVRTVIADTGPGIPPQILGKIFTPFFTTKAQGTGLGLAICHKLITQHHGTISVNSEDGRGTEFIIDIPAVTLPGEEAPDAPGMEDNA